MIVSGYSIDAYCDCPDCGESIHIAKQDCFASDCRNPKSDCIRQMKCMGWKIDVKTRTCYSPECLLAQGVSKIPKYWIEAAKERLK